MEKRKGKAMFTVHIQIKEKVKLRKMMASPTLAELTF